MYLVFTRMPGESYRKRLRSLLLCLCDVFRALRELPLCVDPVTEVKCFKTIHLQELPRPLWL